MDLLALGADRRPWIPYAGAIVLPFVAFGLHRELAPVLAGHMPFLFYSTATVVMAIVGGLGPGLVATALCTVLLHVSGTGFAREIGLTIFLLNGVIASVLSEIMRRALRTSRELRRAREQLLSIVAHDLRNPLSAVSLSARAMRSRAPADMQRGLGVIERNALRMDRLIADLLDATRLEVDGRLTVRTKTEDAHELVSEALEVAQPQATSKGVDLDATLPATLPHVVCDRERVLQVIGNLLGNATRLTPSGGRITVRLADAGGAVRFEVADTGPGVAAADMDHLFERHWKGRGSTGTGLGLFIAAAIVRAHGGRIWCHSEPGFGASFFFTLPVATSATSQPHATEATGAPHS